MLCVCKKKRIFILRKCILRSLKSHDACNLFSNGSKNYIILHHVHNTVCLHVLTDTHIERERQRRERGGENDKVKCKQWMNWGKRYTDDFYTILNFFASLNLQIEINYIKSLKIKKMRQMNIINIHNLQNKGKKPGAAGSMVVLCCCS